MTVEEWLYWYWVLNSIVIDIYHNEALNMQAGKQHQIVTKNSIIRSSNKTIIDFLSYWAHNFSKSFAAVNFGENPSMSPVSFAILFLLMTRAFLFKHTLCSNFSCEKIPTNSYQSYTDTVIGGAGMELPPKSQYVF